MDDRRIQLTEAVNAVCASGATDLLVFNGPIDDTGFNLVVETTNKPTSDAMLMILTTLGGDADAAYRIAKLLCRRYKTFRLLVPSYCKSAGTLIALGASEIVMTDIGELGPLDVQIRKRDELLMRESGLEMVQGLQQLTDESIEAFRKTFIEVASGTGLSTRLCADIAANVVGNLYGNIFSQIDPIRLGSVTRANAIAMHYGKLLGSKNLKPDSLGRLVLGYPSHDFVIDRSQAEQLFNSVRPPNPAEAKLVQAIEVIVKNPSSDKHIVIKLEPTGGSHGATEPLATAGSKRKAKRSSKASAGGQLPVQPGAPGDAAKEPVADSRPGASSEPPVPEAVVPADGARQVRSRTPRAPNRRPQPQGKN